MIPYAAKFKVLRACETWWGAAVFAVFFQLIGFGLLAAGAPIWLGLVGVGLFVVALQLLVFRPLRAERRRVRALGFDVCPRCGYALAGLPACGECGRDCRGKSLRSDWAALGVR